MTVSQRLDLRQSQNLVMTPQLQQAIKLLQMSNLELSEFIREEAEKNPLLEVDAEGYEKRNDTEKTPVSDEVAGLDQVNVRDAVASLDTEYENLYSDDYGADRPEREVSVPQDDIYGSSSSYLSVSSSSSSYGEDEDRDFSGVSKPTLHGILSEQLQIATRDPITRMIGSYLIGALSETGYLTETTEEIATVLNLSEQKVKEALIVCQTFEPAGVFARSLKECLFIQLREAGNLVPAYEKLLDHLEAVARYDFNFLSRVCGVPKNIITDMVTDLRKLSPKPGLLYSNEPLQPIIPDVLIREGNDGGWMIEINQDTLPKIAINRDYRSDLSKNGNQETKEYVQENFNQATWLLKSLDQRAKTILRVAGEIVKQQDGFFAHGVSELRPMNLKIVAEALSLHESTVSRVTAGKYLRCPRGIYEMKFFFMSGVSGEGEDAVASGTVKHLIKKYIDAEDPRRILSDDTLVEMLSEQGIQVARRTVAKYRDAAGIPSSVKRRRLKKIY